MVRDAPAVTLTGSPREVARAVAARLDDAARAGRPEAEGDLLHALRVSPQVDLILGELTLARISHRPVKRPAGGAGGGEEWGLEPVAEYADALLRRLGESDAAAPADAARQLLDLVRRPPFLAAIAAAGTTSAWADRIVELAAASRYTVATLLEQRLETGTGQPFLRLPTGDGGRSLTIGDVGSRVDLIARGVMAVLEERGEGRVAILSENRLEMALVDLACLSSGLVDVMVPATATADDVAFILAHSRAVALVVSSHEQLAKVQLARRQLPALHTVIGLDEPLRADDEVLTLANVVSEATRVAAARLDERRSGMRADDLATIMYTSGTTGRPKGIMFSQLNIVAKRFCRALALPDIGGDDVFLCYLPLYHTFGRFLELIGALFWGATYAFAGDPSLGTLLQRMKEYRPTIFVSIPKRWIQLYEAVRSEIDVENEEDAAIRAVVERLTGGRLRWGLSAAGYLDPEIFQFFQRHGIELMSGFGMTEATGGITMTPPGGYREGSLGCALPGIELRLAEDGELMIRGPYVMAGYLDPGDAEPAFDADGWFPTNDLMLMDDHGHIRIVDRKKEIYKNVQGQTIAPQKVENLFRDFESVGRVFLVGDHREYNTLLILPDPDILASDLRELSRAELEAHFRSLVVTANRFLAHHERIVDFTLIDRDFDPEKGELTPKGSYRRRTIEGNFRDLISPLYRRRVVSVGGARILVPNWFFQAVGLTTQDVRAEDGRLVLAATGGVLSVLRLSETQVRVGSAVYETSHEPLDLGGLLRNPALWLGNEELLSFAELSGELRRGGERTDSGVAWSRRFASYPPGLLDAAAPGPALPSSLGTLHRAALGLGSDDPQAAAAAVGALGSVIREGTELAGVARRILHRAVAARDVRIARLAFRELASTEPIEVLEAGLDRFLGFFPDLLDDETITAVVSETLPEALAESLVTRISAVIEDPGGAPGGAPGTNGLLRLLTAFGARHPAHYRRARAVLTRAARSATLTPTRTEARRCCDRLRTEFRQWLGPATRLAVDPETGREYRWRDVVTFDDAVSRSDREALLTAFEQTALIREAVFMFYSGTLIQLADVLPEGVWVRLLGTRHGKSVFRVSVQTRRKGQFDLAVNVNHSLGSKTIGEEVDWLIICGEARARGPVVEDFGGHWPDHDLWTEEFIPGKTLDRALRRLAGSAQGRDRFAVFWPFAAWSAVAAYVDFWERTGRSLVVADPDPANVIVPAHDYQTGARLVSIAARERFTSPLAMLKGLRSRLLDHVASEYPDICGSPGWDTVFSAVLEVTGVTEGLSLLEAAAAAAAGSDPDLVASVRSFASDVEGHGFRPMRLHFGALRYHRWAELNPGATPEARASTLREIFETYGLDSLVPDHPEARARFFHETVFRSAEPALAEGIDGLVRQLRLRELPLSELPTAVAELRARTVCDADTDYFLTRLSFPYLTPEDDAAYVSGSGEAMTHGEMVVSLQDADGEPYRIRHAISPKEVGRLHRLFVTENLPVQFRSENRFLVALSERGHLIGGLFYEIDTELKTAHMEKIVVGERHRRKGIATDLLGELENRLRTAGIRSLTTGFFRPQFFYQLGFTVERRHAGLVKMLKDNPTSSRVPYKS